MKVHLHLQPVNVLLIYYLNSKAGLNKQFQTGVGDFYATGNLIQPACRNTKINRWSAAIQFRDFYIRAYFTPGKSYNTFFQSSKLLRFNELH